MSGQTEQHSDSDSNTSTSWVMLDESEKGKQPGKDEEQEMKKNNELDNENENEIEEEPKQRKSIDEVQADWWNEDANKTNPDANESTDNISEVTLPFPKRSVASTNIQPKQSISRTTNCLITVSIIMGSFLVALYFNSEYEYTADETDTYSYTSQHLTNIPAYIQKEYNKYIDYYNTPKAKHAMVEQGYYKRNKHNDIKYIEIIEIEYVKPKPKTNEQKHKKQDKNSKDYKDYQEYKEFKEYKENKQVDKKSKGNFEKNHYKNEYKTKNDAIVVYKEKDLKYKDNKNKKDVKYNKFNKTMSVDSNENMHSGKNENRKKANDWDFNKAQNKNKKKDEALWYFELMADREHIRFKKSGKSYPVYP